MGTPGFAVPCLEILYNAGYDIVGVITSVDKYGGRGRKTKIESDVKKYAVEKQLHIMQPTNLKSPKFVEELAALQADVQVVVAFRMLPEVVWNMPAMGTYNLHGSLLPKYRGAAPINWSIINGDSMTGVTSFKLKHEIDTGSLCIQKEIPIYNSDDVKDLHDRMMWVAADTVLETVRKIESGPVQLTEQDNSLVSHAPKLNKENTRINLASAKEDIYNFVRGLSPYPSAWLKINDKVTKIYEVEIPDEAYDNDQNIICDKNSLKVRVADGYISILSLQLAGKKRMTVKSFLNGFQLDENTIIE